MGLSVKTDSAAAASGALADALINAQPGLAAYKTWVMSTAVMTKIFIDVWIGLWAFILAMIWVMRVERGLARESRPYRFGLGSPSSCWAI